MNTIWTDWRQGKIPCFFSHEQGIVNRHYLECVLGKEFLVRSYSERDSHPISREWYNSGAVSFLKMNSLAEDLRLLEKTPGFNRVVHDICDLRQCLPTWHMVHVAALFERRVKNSVIELVDADQNDAPDFVVKINERVIPVEAKLLAQSTEQANFEKNAAEIIRILADERKIPIAPISVFIAFKRGTHIDQAAAIDCVFNAVLRYGGAPIFERSEHCNILIEPHVVSIGIEGYQSFCVLAPVPDNEHLRVIKRAKDASRQLRTLPSIAAGMLALGISEHQDSAKILANLEKRMRQGYLKAVSGIMLIRQADHVMMPCLMPVDLMELRRNSHADEISPDELPIAPLAGHAELISGERHLEDLRSYRYAEVRARVKDPTNLTVAVPNLRHLTPELVA